MLLQEAADEGAFSQALAERAELHQDIVFAEAGVLGGRVLAVLPGVLDAQGQLIVLVVVVVTDGRLPCTYLSSTCT